MPNTESEVIQTILKRGGKAKKGDVVKELGISLGYLDIITRSLERRGLVKFSKGVYFLTSSGKKKLAEFIQKKVRKLKAKPSSQVQVEGKKRGRPKKQKTEFKDNDSEPKIKLTEQTPYQFATRQAEEPKELPVETLLGQRMGELKEGVADVEKKVEEGVKNIVEKIEKELEGKIETVKETVGPAVGKVEELPPIILQFGKFLLSTSKKILVWISKNYKNLTKKRS